MKKTIILAAAAAAMMVSPGAIAQIIKQYRAKDLTVQVDPKTSYIFYRTQVQMPVDFIRTPDNVDIDVWRGLRQLALDKEMKKYRAKHRTYLAEQKSWDRAIPQQRKGMTKPVEPVMPTLDTIAFPTIEMSTLTSVWLSPAFFKEKPVFGFLVAVKPGTYAVYGSIVVTPNGAVGTCMCMGTVKFDAKPGEIVDLGIFASPGIGIGERPPRLKPYDKPLQSELRRFDGPLPARLQGLPVRPAEFRAAGKFPNYFGVTIDRFAPMPGVLSYWRDTIIDDRTGQPIAQQTESLK
jgi:hypothetical protein